ncbi:MAG: proteinase inhibitor [Polyangiaceae bacterium]
MLTPLLALAAAAASTLGACSSSGSDGTADASAGSDAGVETGTGALPEPTLKSSITPVTRVEDAKPKTFIPAFVDCRAPKSGDTGAGPEGKVCTTVSMAGCTEAGKYYPDYASCDVVRTQRPYWPARPANVPDANDPRLADADFMRELAWVTEQVRASACTCCHDSTQAPMGPSQWYVDAKPIWTDTVSNGGAALFAGLADSSVLGAYAAKDNNGFQRDFTGLPSTDGPRMRAFFVKELARRGISEEEAKATPPFGGPLYAMQKTPPAACDPGTGVDAEGKIVWSAPGTARYVYVLDRGSENPGVPPNLDKPAGTRWRLDVLASRDALGPGFSYGTTPDGSFQALPETGRAPALVAGTTYQLAVYRDVAFPLVNCLFEYRGP